MTTNNLYELLEVDRNADPEAIKKAYRKQALRWHPGMFYSVIICK